MSWAAIACRRRLGLPFLAASQRVRVRADKPATMIAVTKSRASRFRHASVAQIAQQEDPQAIIGSFRRSRLSRGWKAQSITLMETAPTTPIAYRWRAVPLVGEQSTVTGATAGREEGGNHGTRTG